jgi:hypothetical protein
MTQHLINKTAPIGDGISGFTDEVAGKDTKPIGLFRGTRLRFGKTAEWEVDDNVIEQDARFVLIDLARIVTKWGADKMPVETVVLEPGEKWPDVEAWNDAVPRSEWLQGMNGPQGPWQQQQIVYFVDPKTMTTYHWPDGSVGGRIAIREAVESTKAMRRFRPGAAPVIELGSKFMNTRFGGRQRPHFVIHSWVNMPGDENPQPAAALPAPDTKTAKPAKQESFVADGGCIVEVKPVTLSEEMADFIPW